MKHPIALVLALALLSSALGSTAPARADDAASLLAKHRTYVGWQFGDGTLTSLKATGKITTTKDGKTETYRDVTVLRLGILSRTTLHDPKTDRSEESGFTGNLFWQSDDNGFKSPVLGDAQKLAIDQDMIFNEVTTAMPGVLRGNETIDGTPCTIVRISPQNAFAMDLYVDPSTGAYKRVVIDPDGANQTVLDILAYAPASPGKLVASKYARKNSTRTLEFTSIEGNAPVAPAALHPPDQVASWTFANGKPFPVTITDDRVYFEATVNGTKGKFILDTGNGIGMVFTKKFADRANLKEIEKGVGYGIGGANTTHYAKVDAFVVGGNTLSDVIAHYSDFGNLDADGIIGYTLLAGVISRLSFSERTLTIEDPSTDISAVQGIHTVVDLSSGQPTLPMKLDKTIDVNATLDSGNPLYVLFGQDIIYKYGVRMVRGELLAGGVGGYEVEECGHIDDLSIGPIDFQTPSACVSPAFTGRDVLVGFAFMKNFDFVFDYPHSAMVVTPIKR